MFTSPKELLKAMDPIKYGWYNNVTHKCIFPDDPDFDNNYKFYNECRVLLPNEVWKYKCGTCYDQTLFEYNELSKINTITELKSFFYLICDSKYKIASTHTGIVYKDTNGWYYFEHAYEKYKGIYGPKTSLNAIYKVVKRFTDMKSTDILFFDENVGIDTFLNDKNITLAKCEKHFWRNCPFRDKLH